MSGETIIVESYSHECEGEELVTPLLQRLQDEKKVKNLYLVNVPLGDNGAALVANMLAKNQSLQTLYLNGSEITDVGLSCLAKALETNATLRKLSISDNEITDEGMELLGRSLQRNKGLEELKVLDNSITKLGRVWGHVSISKLNLAGNRILNIPRKYLGQRRVSNCKMAQLRRFLKKKDEEITSIENRVLSTARALPNQDDIWRLKTIGHHDEFRQWLIDLTCDHDNFVQFLLGIKHGGKSPLTSLRHGFHHIVRDVFRFLFVGNEKHYSFARAHKILRVVDTLPDEEGSCTSFT